MSDVVLVAVISATHRQRDHRVISYLIQRRASKIQEKAIANDQERWQMEMGERSVTRFHEHRVKANADFIDVCGALFREEFEAARRRHNAAGQAQAVSDLRTFPEQTMGTVPAKAANGDSSGTRIRFHLAMTQMLSKERSRTAAFPWTSTSTTSSRKPPRWACPDAAVGGPLRKPPGAREAWMTAA